MSVDRRPIDPPSDTTGEFTDTNPTPPPVRLGEYRIIREIGRGGMGVVYEAIQESLGRHVALKVLPTPPPGQEAMLERFRREARAAARLHHTNIVPVFDVGCDSGVHYYVMQFIQGQPLDDVLNEVRRLRSSETANHDPPSQVARNLLTNAYQPPNNANTIDESAGLPRRESIPESQPPRLVNQSSSLASQPATKYFRACARLIQQAADGLAYAHAQGVLHRDIKPSNILLDIHGAAWITDFGLAKFDDDVNITRTGDIIGTLRYMAPERFNGHGDGRSDVYALGITLYEMLTLRPAFEANNRLQLIDEIANREPPHLTKIERTVPHDLATIVAKAIEKEPNRRYATAAALADDLQRYLDDRPIRARKVGLTERAIRWSKRNPYLVTAAMTVVIVASVGAVATLRQSAVAQKEANDARNANIELKKKEDELRRTLYAAQMTLAHTSLTVPRGVNRVRELLKLNEPQEQHYDLRSFEWHYLNRHSQTSQRAIAQLDVPIGYPVMSRHGKWLVVFGDDDSTRLIDLATGHVKWSVSGQKRQTRLMLGFGPDDRYVLVQYGPQLRALDVSTGEVISSFRPAANKVVMSQISSDAQRLATVDTDLTIRIWQLDSEREPLVIGKTDHLPFPIAFTPNNKMLLVKSQINNKVAVSIFDAFTGQLLRTFQESAVDLESLAVSPDSQMMAMGGVHIGEKHGQPSAWVALWDLESGQKKFDVPSKDGRVWDVRFSDDNKWLLAGSSSWVSAWDIESNKPIFTLGDETGVASTSWAMSPDKRRLAISGTSAHIQVWNLEDLKVLTTFVHRGHRSWVRGLCFTPDSQRILSTGEDGMICEWDANRSTPLVEKIPVAGIVRVVRYSRDGSRLIYGACDERGLESPASIIVCNSQGHSLEKEMHGHHYRVNTLSLSPDGRLLASADALQIVKIWDLPSGQVLQTLSDQEHSPGVGFGGAIFSPDGIQVAAVGRERDTIVVWNVQTGKPEYKFKTTPDWGGSMTFHPNGKYLVIAKNNNICYRDAKTGDIKRSITSPSQRINAITFSRDGRFLASAEDLGIIRLWEASTGQELRTIRGHLQYVGPIAFSPDGKRIASGSSDGTVKLWDVKSGLEVWSAKTDDHSPQSLAFHPDGFRLAAACEKEILIWDATPRQRD